MILIRILKLSDKGDDVVELQRSLIGWGSKDQPVIMTGVFDIITEAAIRRFQLEHKIEPNGTADEKTITSLNNEAYEHPIDFETLKCPCGICACRPYGGGFGQERFENEYISGKPKIEAHHKYEYPGIDATLIWALMALMHRAAIPGIHITSGYRCWIHNERTGRMTTNHLGKAVDFIGAGSGVHNGSSIKKVECTECARIRRIAIEECGFQGGWTQENRISLELPIHGAYTWVHIDTRMIPRNLRRHITGFEIVKQD